MIKVSLKRYFLEVYFEKYARRELLCATSLRFINLTIYISEPVRLALMTAAAPRLEKPIIISIINFSFRPFNRFRPSGR